MWLPWLPALAMALVVAGIALAARAVAARRVTDRRMAVAGMFAGEIALVLALYALWRYAGGLSVMQVDGAMDRGRSVWQLQRSLHLPSEAALQRLVLPHPLLVQAANRYYAVMHVPAIIAILFWAFVWHRDRYPIVRNCLAMVTAACLAIQLVPVAPPRMFPELGFVDTAHLYGQSVYGAVGTGISDQLSAMPSVHVGWAVLVGLAAVLIGTSRWRWIVLAHPVLTVLVVAVTANHWWLDGVVAVVLLGISVGLHLGSVATARRFRLPTFSGRPAMVEVEPAPALVAAETSIGA
ncbi:MAG TPA: phosphatase PAP2 family protein [Acidimicrobiales bacterium]